jgi:hypothetical protein
MDRPKRFSSTLRLADATEGWPPALRTFNQ